MVKNFFFLGKGRQFVDFTELNMTCLKEPLPLPNIDILTEYDSSYKMHNFMDAYLGYDQIKMNHLDAPKTLFYDLHL